MLALIHCVNHIYIIADLKVFFAGHRVLLRYTEPFFIELFKKSICSVKGRNYYFPLPTPEIEPTVACMGCSSGYYMHYIVTVHNGSIEFISILHDMHIICQQCQVGF